MTLYLGIDHTELDAMRIGVVIEWLTAPEILIFSPSRREAEGET